MNKQPLWVPTAKRVSSSNLAKFSAFIDRHPQSPNAPNAPDYWQLHSWSVNHSAEFWNALWDFCEVQSTKCEPYLINSDEMPGAEFFPSATLNFAQNLLVQSGPGEAIVFRAEDQVEMRWSHDELRAHVSRLQQAFKAAGLKKGDRVAAMMPNMPHTIAAFLAVSSIGAIWSSCSPDFGERGVLDRFGQIKPAFFIACDGYYYNGKRIDILDKLEPICAKLAAKSNIIVSLLGEAHATAQRIDNAISYDDFCDGIEASELTFEELPFNHPLYILFSSGTTGIPKCIVHSQGGALLMHLREHQLHCDIGQGDRVFYFTTCGWMMWNWLVSALASKATLMLYDGSPFYPDGNSIFDYCEREKFTFLGTSAKFIDAVRNAGLKPGRTHDLSSLKSITSTGSPLANENFRFVYDSIKSDIHLASMSGGTDIVACFVIGVPTLPVYEGEIQAPALGMSVAIWDDDQNPLDNEKGELVCAKPFPSMPVGFWNDPQGEKYKAAYFDRFENVWCHGDFAQVTPRGGYVIHGRSDATLNPGGVRIGTAEIYNQVEQLQEVSEALCIGQEWPKGSGDVRIVMFVVTNEDYGLDEDLITKIKHKIRTGASPRHVPAVVIRVADLPRTKSGKITELAVRDVVHGKTVKNKEALANPQALELFKDLPQLQR